MLPTQRSRLACGLQVVAVHTPHLHSTSFCLAVGCGSRHDPAAKPGLSHLLEHMLFRGSRALADTTAVSQAFEAAGGSLDAGTWRDHMELSATLHPDRLAAALNALADVVVHPRLEAASLELERGIVLEELRAELDEDGRDTCPTNLSRARIWGEHPLGRPILGTAASLADIACQDLMDHHRRHFVGGNMVLALVGPNPPEAMLAAASAAMAGVPAGPAASDGPAPPALAGRRVLAVQQPGSQCSLQLTFAAPADRGAALVPASQVVSILDDGFATRLPEALIHRRGWIYDLETGLDCYRDAGLLDVTLQVEPGRVGDAAVVVLETLARLGTHGPSDQELARVRQRLEDDARFQLDDTLGLSCRFAALALFGQPIDLSEELARALRCRGESIQQAARAMFVDAPLHVTVVGPQSRALRELLERVITPASAAA